MRFDDMLATLLARPLPDEAARIALWRQLVDVVAQRHGEATAESDAAFDMLRHLRGDVPPRVRGEAARAIAGRRVPAELVALFAEEPPAIAGPVLGEVELSSDEWVALLPSLGPTARGLLRHRRDLPRAVVTALGSFGSSDFVIPGPPTPIFVVEVPPAPEPDAPLAEGEAQIRDLLSRIEAFRGRVRATRDTAVPAAPPADADAPRVEQFRFETGSDGVIHWVEGAPRGPIIGETLAVAAPAANHGVDGQAAGAFRQRAPFRDARLTIAGEGPAGGEWRISGIPFFASADGRFVGYRCTARRPRADETAITAVAEPQGLFGAALAPDSLRQLVHELRTPLNAIVGFSELIERQYMGPAAAGYRHRAGEIITQARRLLGAIDDLDMAARFERAISVAASAPVDVGALLDRLGEDYGAIASARGVILPVAIEGDLPAVGGDVVAVERMIARLLAATIAVAADGETVAVALDRIDDRSLGFSVTRPAALAGRDEHALLDPGFAPGQGWSDEEWPEAPVLGLGFALRLVRNLASGIGGALEIDADRFRLMLPVATPTADAREGGA